MNDKELLDLHDRYNSQIADLRLGLNSADLLYLAQNRPFDVGATLAGEFYVGETLCNGDWLVTNMYLTIASELYRFNPSIPQLHVTLQYLQGSQPDPTMPETITIFTKIDERWEPGQWIGIPPRIWDRAGQHYIVKE